MKKRIKIGLISGLCAVVIVFGGITAYANLSTEAYSDFLIFF